MEDFKKYKLIQDVKTGTKVLVDIQESVNILTRIKAKVSSLNDSIPIAGSAKATAILKYNELIKERNDLQEKIKVLEA